MEDNITLVEYYKDEDWSPDNRTKTRGSYMTRSKTNKLAPPKHSICSCDVSHAASKVCVGKSVKSKIVKKKKKQMKLTVVSDNIQLKSVTEKKKTQKISQYELQIQKNIEERKKMFQMLQLGDVKQDLMEVFNIPTKRKLDEEDDLEKKTSPVAKRGRPTKGKQELGGKRNDPKKRVSLPPLRASTRERKTTKFYDYLHEEESLTPQRSSTSESLASDDMSDSSSSADVLCTPLGMRLRGQRRRGVNQSMESVKEHSTVTDAVLTLGNTFVDQSSLDESSTFVKEITPFLEKNESGDSGFVTSDLKEFVDLLKCFDVSTDDVASVVPKKINSLAWHPNTSRSLLAVGDISGTIGFWDIDCENEFQRTRIYDVHSSHVTGLSFDKFNPLRLFSTSKDGYVRLLDFRTEVFEDIYSIQRTSKSSFPIHHIQKDYSTLLVSHADGRVATIDTRTLPTRVEQQFKCFEGSIPSLSHHPVNENLIMASCVNGQANIFDLRFVQPISSEESTVPFTCLPQVSSRLSGAFFSPVTGDYALVTGKNVMEVYDLREGASKCPESWDLSRSRRNPMLSYGVWHPKREDICLATASESKSIEIFTVSDGELLHGIQQKGNSNSCVISFHPLSPILASASSSTGRVNLFRAPV